MRNSREPDSGGAERANRRPLRLDGPHIELLSDEIAESRSALRRLEANLHANPERLSVASLNGVVARLLRNQVLLLEGLQRLLGALESEDAVAPGASEPGLVDEVPADALEPPAAVSAQGGTSGPAEVPPADARPSEDMRSPVERVVPEPPGDVPPGAAHRAVCGFDNQEKSYEKGLEKLRRWALGGTPIQMRGEMLFLRASGCSPEMLERLLTNVTGQMGFSRRLGRLVVPGVDGEIWLFEKEGLA